MSAITPELIGAVFSGVVLTIGALATFTAARSRRQGDEHKALKRLFRTLQRKYLAAMEHLWRLEEYIAARGLKVPDRPAILEADDDDDTPIVSAPPPAPPPPTPGVSGGG